MSVIHFKEKIKSFMAKPRILDYLEVGVILLVGIGSFGLGRLSVTNNTNIDTVNNSGVVVLSQNQRVQTTTQTKSISPSTVGQVSDSGTSNTQGGAFVASRSGKKYYPVGCGSANRIKTENKVYFDTEEEAEARGLTRTETCK